MALALALHVLAAIIWVGGMFFAYLCLRPVAATLLEPPQRLPLWSGVFNRFFRWVWAAVVVLPVTGYWMIFVRFGGLANAGLHIQIMQGIGLLMIAIYLFLYFGPYQDLRSALADQRLADAGRTLNRIRRIVALNLTLGLIVGAVASGGRWLGLG